MNVEFTQAIIGWCAYVVLGVLNSLDGVLGGEDSLVSNEVNALEHSTQKLVLRLQMLTRQHRLLAFLPLSGLHWLRRIIGQIAKAQLQSKLWMVGCGEVGIVCSLPYLLEIVTDFLGQSLQYHIGIAIEHCSLHTI